MNEKRSGPLVRLKHAVLLLLAACGSGGTEPPPQQTGIALEVVASGLAEPLHLTAPPGDDRLFVVEKRGTIRIIAGGQLLPTPFLDIQSQVRNVGEQGLLSMAFHPDYAANGFFYVNYTDLSGDTHVERYTVSGNANVADAGSAKLILFVEQPFSNHNGGLVVFGPDDMLYIGMGDGGNGGDPLGHGQNRSTLLGDILRIDVDGGDPYAIPPDNPYASSTDQARREIWAYGLRNPWRFAFDRTAGMLYIADVGQNQWEEINAVPANSAGRNYGWNIMEGAHCFNASSCNQQGLTLPVQEYDHSQGCSVTGGHVYRGSSMPLVVGHYFYADLCQGWVRSFRLANSQATDHRAWDFGDIGSIYSFGEDAEGELYILSANGRVYKMVPN